MIRLPLIAKTDSHRAERCTILIDRKIGLIHVRPYRRKRMFTLPLDAVASMIVMRVVKAEVFMKRLEKKEQRDAKKSNRATRTRFRG